MLSVAGLCFDYGTTPLLRDVGFQIPPGDVVCLIGPNGAGKSTLLRCVAGVLRPSAGRVLVDGRPTDGFSRDELARAIAYVPQHGGPTMFLSVVDMIALGRAPHRGRSSRVRDRAVIWNAIERLGLAALAFRPCHVLSGGERQRVLIARALAQEARLMLLDEPTSSLDPYHQVETISIIRAICKEHAVAALVAIHDLSLAARLADRLVLMHKGRLEAEGEWRHVLTSDLLKRTFGVSAHVGLDSGLPYVVPFK